MRSFRKGSSMNNQAKYYVFKILVGSDKRYLPFLTNISEMPKISDEAYLIMDEDSIEMTRNEVYADGASYYDLILNSGCRILTTEQLVERAVEDENLKLEANNTFKKLRALTNYKFSNFLPEHSFEILPPSLVADYAKAFVLHGFQDQHPESVNIYMDLDVMQGEEHKLPQNPINLLEDYYFGVSVAASYSLDASSIDDLIGLLTQEDSELLSANKYVSERWDEYKDRLKSGKDHQSFFTRDSGIADMRLDHDILPKGGMIGLGVEYMVAGSKLLPIHTSIEGVAKNVDAFIRMATEKAEISIPHLEKVEKIKEVLEETKDLRKKHPENQQLQELQEQTTKAILALEEPLIKDYTDFLQVIRRPAVDLVVNNAYNMAMRERFKPIYPEELGIVGRHDVQSWRGVGGGPDAKFIYSPNLESLQSLYHPWNRVLKDFEKDFAKLGSQSEAPNTSLKVDQFINFLNPQTNKALLGGAALVGSAASLASSEFALPTILLGAAAALLYYKYGVKKDDGKESDKSR